MKIAIGNDHAAVELKKTIMEYVESMGHEVTNFGTDSSESCNYPEYGEKVANAVASGEFDCGLFSKAFHAAYLIKVLGQMVYVRELFYESLIYKF